jgi:hypothetical protein
MRKFGFSFLLAISLSVVGCGESPCQQAFDKIKDCFASVDCTKYPAAQQPVCNAEKTAFTQASSPSDCNNPNAILDCTLDPQKLCGCK